MTIALSPRTKLQRIVTDEGVSYEGEGRSYLGERSTTASKLTLRIKVEGSTTPRVESISAYTSKSHHELAKRLAGELHHELAALYEQDFLQIVQEESEERNRQAESSAHGDCHVLAARFDGLIDLVINGQNVEFLVSSRSSDNKVALFKEFALPS